MSCMLEVCTLLWSIIHEPLQTFNRTKFWEQRIDKGRCDREDKGFMTASVPAADTVLSHVCRRPTAEGTRLLKALKYADGFYVNLKWKHPGFPVTVLNDVFFFLFPWTKVTQTHTRLLQLLTWHIPFYEGVQKWKLLCKREGLWWIGLDSRLNLHICAAVWWTIPVVLGLSVDLQ